MVTRTNASQMMLNSEEEEVLQRPTHSQPEILCPSVNDVPVRKAARKVADEYLNLSQKIGSKEQLDKYVEDYEIFNGKGQPVE